MNNASKQELKTTIATQFRAMTEYEDAISTLSARIRELEENVKRLTYRGFDDMVHHLVRELEEENARYREALERIASNALTYEDGCGCDDVARAALGVKP